MSVQLHWLAVLAVSFWLAGYSADRIGIPAYGNNIPFSWFWTPVYVASLLVVLLSVFNIIVWIFP